jgi:hypothetical protein
MEPEDREFMRQLLLRHEKATDAMIKRLNDAGAADRARAAEILARTKANTEAIRAHTREFVAEMQAQRQALFRVLDRLDGKSA